uniref:Uncharacterized protein n=1 Tax=Manihot esculenta TaxID=3983 RepID=A0A2C9VZV6_MANES
MWLPPMCNLSRTLERLPMDSGIIPCRRLPPKARNLRRVVFVKEVMNPRPLSPELTILLKPMLYISRNRRFPRPADTVPSKRLHAILMIRICVRLCKDPGIVLVNLLKLILKPRSLGSLYPTSAGIFPCSWFADKAK